MWRHENDIDKRQVWSEIYDRSGTEPGHGIYSYERCCGKTGISTKYLEQILPVLTKNKLIEAVHGKGGGYRLVRKPEEYTVGEILRLTENSLTSVACLADGAASCDRADTCITLDFWKGLDNVVNQYLDEHTLADFVK